MSVASIHGRPRASRSHLAWHDSPDKTVPRFPAGPYECGADLAGAADLGVATSHQTVDIPLQTATVTQHDLYEVQCPAAGGCTGRREWRRPMIESGAAV